MNTPPADLSRPGGGWYRKNPPPGFSIFSQAEPEPANQQLRLVGYLLLRKPLAPAAVPSEGISGPVCGIVQAHSHASFEANTKPTTATAKPAKPITAHPHTPSDQPT